MYCERKYRSRYFFLTRQFKESIQIFVGTFFLVTIICVLVVHIVPDYTDVMVTDTRVGLIDRYNNMQHVPTCYNHPLIWFTRTKELTVYSPGLSYPSKFGNYSIRLEFPLGVVVLKTTCQKNCRNLLGFVIYCRVPIHWWVEIPPVFQEKQKL